MTSKLPERANMPVISAAAHKTLSTYPTYNNQHYNPASSKQITATCKSCGQTYNQTALTRALEKMPQLPDFDYDNQCLNCIKLASQAIKSSKYPAIRDLRQDLDEISAAYQLIYNKWKAASKEFQDLDYQEKLIDHEQKIRQKIQRLTTKKPIDTKTNTTLAMQILANLSDEQKALVLAQIRKQSNSNA